MAKSSRPGSSEPEDFRAFQEESSFLREVKREAGEIDAPFIHLGFGKVSVVAQGANEIWREILIEIKAPIPLVISASWPSAVLQCPRSPVRPEGDAHSEVDLIDSLEAGGLSWVIKKVVLFDRSQTDGLLLSGDVSFYVDTPVMEVGLEGNGLEGNFDFSAPAFRTDLALGIPDAVPIETGMLAEGQALASSSAGVDYEDVGISFIKVGVEQHLDYIVADFIIEGIVSHYVSADAGRLAIGTKDPEIKIGLIVDDAKLGSLGRFAFPGKDHAKGSKGNGLFPGFIVQAPVEGRTTFYLYGFDDLGLRPGLRLLSPG